LFGKRLLVDWETVLLISLQSGSSGNCIYVESQGVRLLFDAGLSALQVTQRLALHGRSADSADALFISHDHYDHVRCAGIYARKFKVPLFVTQRTLGASRRSIVPGPGMDVQYFRAGNSVKVGHLTVETVATPHDAADGVVFVIDDGRHRLGICTDVGHVFGDLKSLVKSVDGLFLESNYDEAMLANGPYPQRLKQRISGSRGHISNREAAELVASSASDKLQWLCLAHLSDKNNTPRKALAEHRALLGSALPIQLTSRSHATDSVGLDEAVGGLSTRRQLAFDF
jgi:phosphoribosyl 1,2-cyclic phosphodiesterase